MIRSWQVSQIEHNRGGAFRRYVPIQCGMACHDQGDPVHQPGCGCPVPCRIKCGLLDVERDHTACCSDAAGQKHGVVAIACRGIDRKIPGFQMIAKQHVGKLSRAWQVHVSQFLQTRTIGNTVLPSFRHRRLCTRPVSYTSSMSDGTPLEHGPKSLVVRTDDGNGLKVFAAFPLSIKASDGRPDDYTGMTYMVFGRKAVQEKWHLGDRNHLTCE